MMHGREKSDPTVVAKKPTNKAGPTAAESAERRAGAPRETWVSTACAGRSTGKACPRR